MPEWKSQYIDYKRLKSILHKFPEKKKGSAHSAISRVLSKSGLAKLSAMADQPQTQIQTAENKETHQMVIEMTTKSNNENG
ncbi:MAG: hypothetical protein ACK559_03970, partial [bacterium]